MNSVVSPPSNDSNGGADFEVRPRTRSLRRALWAALAVAFLVVVAVLFFHGRYAKRAAPPQIADTHSSAMRTLRLKGMTAAVEARSIQAPLIAGAQVGTLTITKMVPSGTRVKQGDLLVEFDRQAQLRDSIDKQAQSEDENEKVIEEQAKEAADKAAKKNSRDKKAARAARVTELRARVPTATDAQWKDWARGLGGYFAGSKTLEWAVKWVEKKV